MSNLWKSDPKKSAHEIQPNLFFQPDPVTTIITTMQAKLNYFELIPFEIRSRIATFLTLKELVGRFARYN